MSFFTLSNGQVANAADTAEGLETGKLVQIPDGTRVVAIATAIESLEVREGQEATAVDGLNLGWKIEWEIIQKGEYLATTVKQGIKCFATKAKTHDEAINVIVFLDNLHNGGALIARGVEPTKEEFLAAIEGKPTVIHIRGQESTDPVSGRTGYFNWVGGVFPHKGGADAGAPAHANKDAAIAAALAQKQKQDEARKKAQEKAKAAAAEAQRLADEAAAEIPDDEAGVMPVDDEEIPY